ncbi:hypothetical protein JCGZ_13630 [Jatropha curcas]|uniref:Uncharacterized protein n=1 Tax=Jatropha curcas TaxID=180498 RepID=A0A067KMK4_JATCU|nr:hypothetical protein JCGZ_13630 [Jatropha curcas]
MTESSSKITSNLKSGSSKSDTDDLELELDSDSVSDSGLDSDSIQDSITDSSTRFDTGGGLSAVRSSSVYQLVRGPSFVGGCARPCEAGMPAWLGRAGPPPWAGTCAFSPYYSGGFSGSSGSRKNIPRPVP